MCEELYLPARVLKISFTSKDAAAADQLLIPRHWTVRSRRPRKRRLPDAQLGTRKTMIDLSAIREEKKNAGRRPGVMLDLQLQRGEFRRA